MRITRTLLLAAIAAIAALALTVATATADHLGVTQSTPQEEQPGETLMVTDEAGVACGSVTTDGQTPPHSVSGGCEISAHGDQIALIGHAFGFEATASTCDIEFSGHVDANGEGWIDAAHHEDPVEAGTCTRRPCEIEPGVMEPWPAHGDEEPTLGEYLQVEFCVLDTEGTDPQPERCLVHVPINEVSPHVYSSGGFHTTRSTGENLNAVNHENATNCEIEVPEAHPITIEGTPIELVH